MTDEMVEKAARAEARAARKAAAIAARAEYEALPETVRLAQHARLAGLLATATWVFAKTMPQNPHFYTLRKTCVHDADFVWAVEQIRLRGYRQKYQGNWYTQLDVGEHFYWTMGWPVGTLDWGWERLNKAGTILINRKSLPSPESEGGAR